MLNRETMSVEEYENGEYIKNHYSREERISRKRDYDGDFLNNGDWTFFNFLRSKKKRNALSFLHLGLLVLVIILFFAYDAINSYFFSGNDTIDGLSIKLTTINNEDALYKGITLYIFITNHLQENQIINFNTIPELYLIKDDIIVYQEKLNIKETVDLSPEESNLSLHYNNTYSYSEKFDFNGQIEYEKIKVIFDIKGKNKIVLEEYK